jgi:hypothetical protein
VKPTAFRIDARVITLVGVLADETGLQRFGGATYDDSAAVNGEQDAQARLGHVLIKTAVADLAHAVTALPMIGVNGCNCRWRIANGAKRVDQLCTRIRQECSMRELAAGLKVEEHRSTAQQRLVVAAKGCGQKVADVTRQRARTAAPWNGGRDILSEYCVISFPPRLTADESRRAPRGSGARSLST